jgi:hypothetical protein
VTGPLATTRGKKGWPALAAISEPEPPWADTRALTAIGAALLIAVVLVWLWITPERSMLIRFTHSTHSTNSIGIEQ